MNIRLQELAPVTRGSQVAVSHNLVFAFLLHTVHIQIPLTRTIHPFAMEMAIVIKDTAHRGLHRHRVPRQCRGHRRLLRVALWDKRRRQPGMVHRATILKSNPQ